MIPGLLHARLAADGAVETPTWDGQLYIHSRPGFGAGPTVAGLLFSVRPDGTYGVQTITGSSRGSGNWFLPTTGAVGAGYEIRFTYTGTPDEDGTVTNPAADWVSLSSLRTFSVTCTASDPGIQSQDFTCLVEIRIAGGGATVSSGTWTGSVLAELNA